jgi:hypothetical protein
MVVDGQTVGFVEFPSQKRMVAAEWIVLFFRSILPMGSSFCQSGTLRRVDLYQIPIVLCLKKRSPVTASSLKAFWFEKSCIRGRNLIERYCQNELLSPQTKCENKNDSCCSTTGEHFRPQKKYQSEPQM